LVLADEINRATPKTQAALLEAMEEGQVTVDGVSHALPRPFVVVATENPIDYEGTFPLPEAQLDRFLIRVSLGYPGRANELEMLGRQHRAHPLEGLEPVVGVEELLAAQAAVREVHVADPIKEYIVSLVEGTRATRTWRWARRPAAAWRSTTRSAPGPRSRGATTWCRTTSSCWPSRRWPTG
jgi:MoxR-like ATPase